MIICHYLSIKLQIESIELQNANSFPKIVNFMSISFLNRL